MADPKQLALLKTGVTSWNRWREETPNVKVDLAEAHLYKVDLSRANLSGARLYKADLTFSRLSGANLEGADCEWATIYEADLEEAHLANADLYRANLAGANLRRANLHRTHLSESHLTRANFREANFYQANLHHAFLVNADLSDSDLRESDLWSANLTEAKLCRADLRGADLSGAILLDSNLECADVSNSRIYGISAWGLKLDNTRQESLVISRSGDPEVTVDNLELAQFIHLLIDNKKVREAIDIITAKVVLILGSFARNRKVILDALRRELRTRNYVPILFDFEKPHNRDVTETISMLAHMARFVIADITEAKSVPQELMRIVPGLPSVPVQPLLQVGEHEYGMFEHFKKYPWVLEILTYDNTNDLVKSLVGKVIVVAEARAKKLTK